MKMRVSDEFRLKVSRKYLDWAEVLPKFGGGPIAALQRIREHQRKDSKRAHEFTRPPEGTTCLLMYFRLFEIFQLEDFEQFQKALLRFMPELSSLSGRNTYDSLIEFPKGDTVSWLNLGAIISKGIWLGGVHHLAPDLPEEIRFIELGLHRVLPSVFAISFDVHLTESAMSEIAHLQANYYLPDVVLHDLLPRSGFIAHSFSRAETVMTQNIKTWTSNLRNKTEAYLRPILNGFFSNQPAIHHSRLPAIEVYAVRGVPESNDLLKEWERQVSHLYESLGFASHLNHYKNGKCLFELPERGRLYKDAQVQARFIVLWEPYLKSLSLEQDETDKVSALKYHTQYMVQDAFGFVALLAFLDIVEDNADELKRLAFKKAAHSSLRQSIRLNERLSRTSILLDIVSQEFAAWKDGMGKSHSHELQELKRANRRTDDEEKRLIADLISFIDYRLKRLQQIHSYVKDAFSNYLVLRNMEAIYKLQLTAAWAAAAAVIITLISLLGDDLIELFRAFT
jgi:hypothetical protein